MTHLIAPKLTLLARLMLALPLLAPAAGAETARAPVAVPFAAIHASSATVGGARVLPTTRTVAHWFGTARNPHNGVTYGFNMAGADPALETSTTVTADIVPVNVVVDGQAFRGTDVVQPVLDSPLFTNQDYTSTPLVTNTLDGTTNHGFTTGGPLSGGNTSNQLEDATMRSQFDKQGTGYHLLLRPVVHDPITIVVPRNLGTLLQTPGGVVAGGVNISWAATRILNLNGSLGYIDPAHLPVYLTNNVMLYSGTDPGNCCVVGVHGATGSGHGNGNQPVQTFAWASYVTPGFFTRSPLGRCRTSTHSATRSPNGPMTRSSRTPWSRG